jgi:hypothetical protein
MNDLGDLPDCADWPTDCFYRISNDFLQIDQLRECSCGNELLACTLFELLERIKKMKLRSNLLRAAVPSVTALAFAVTVAMSANAATLPTYAGIDPGGKTGELSNSGYSGITGTQAGFTNVSTATGYNFVYAAGSEGGNPGNGNTCGTHAACADSEYGNGLSGVGMWSIPTGGTGAFLALDSDYNTSGTNIGTAVQETVSTLVAGDNYTITFDTADAQQNTYLGASQDEVKICLGTQCYTTANVLDASEGSTPWAAQSFVFTASSTSETLTFLGVGGSSPTLGSNVPAFALVDNLQISAPSSTPEPNSLILLGTGLAGLGGLVRSRFVKAAASVA